MAFEIRKISDVGVGHPVARLGVQASDLIPFIDIEDAKRKEIGELYTRALTDRLLRCHQFRDDLFKRANEAAETVKPQNDKRIREVPHVIGLQGIAQGYLYEAKNYLRDLLNLFRIVYGCKLADASAFTNLKGEGDSELVGWAASTFGLDSDLIKSLRTEQEWVAEPIRMRNAVEHPGGLSGSLTVNNIRIDPNQPDKYIPPAWARTGRSDVNIVKDMDCSLDNMLTLAEDLLVGVVMDKSKSKKLIVVRKIPSEDRDPKCPIRLRVEPSSEVLGRLPAPLMGSTGVASMSALPPIADSTRTSRDVCFVPQPDILHAIASPSFSTEGPVLGRPFVLVWARGGGSSWPRPGSLPQFWCRMSSDTASLPAPTRIAYWQGCGRYAAI